MTRFPDGTTVRLYQEDWGPFQNLPTSLREFEATTNVRCVLRWDEVGAETVGRMLDQMEASFGYEAPPYDLVCVDDLLLQKFARDGRVEPLTERVRRDHVDISDFSEATIRAVSAHGEIFGLPCVNVSNTMMYREDLLTRYGIEPPTTLAELVRAAKELQAVMRRDGHADFAGFATRSAKGFGHIEWAMCSTWLPSFGAVLYDAQGNPAADTAEHVEALTSFIDLMVSAGPSMHAEMSWVENIDAYARARSGSSSRSPTNSRSS